MDRNAPPEELLRGIAETAARFQEVGRSFLPERLITPPAPGVWSINEVLWHIRAQSDVYGEHIVRILDEDEPRWRHLSPRARMKKSRYDELPFADSLAAFVQQRTALVDRLASLPPEAWERIAIVKVEKKEWRLTLHERVWGMAQHEESHRAQLGQTAAALA